MNNIVNWYKRYLGWFWKHKVVTAIIVLVLLFVVAVTSGGNGSNQNAADSQAASTDSSQQQTNDNTSQSANSSPATSSTNSNTAPTKPTLRQDLVFQGDPAYCDGIYKDNGNGTTTWSYDVKQNGELITHLSDNNGHTYRHDVQITNAPNYYSYTAPVAINDAAEIDGVLTVSGDSNGHPCNLSPQQQPQQAY
jgi:cytoskeletal protein RodZ